MRLYFPLGQLLEANPQCLRYFEIHPPEYRLHNYGDSALGLGMGMGLLAAAALSTSVVVSDLPLVGAEIVRVAFRVGYHVTQIAEIVEQPSDIGPKAWSRAYLNINEAAALAELDDLNARKVYTSQDTSNCRPN